MTAETDLLPLPEWVPDPIIGHLLNDVDREFCEQYAISYARACVSSATEAARANLAELQREVEGLRAEVEKIQAFRKHHRARHKSYKRRHADAEARAERLAGALRGAMDAAEEAAFERWLSDTSPSGDVEQVQRQWEASADFADFLEEWEEARAALNPAAAQENDDA